MCGPEAVAVECVPDSLIATRCQCRNTGLRYNSGICEGNKKINYFGSLANRLRLSTSIVGSCALVKTHNHVLMVIKILADP